MDDLDKSELIIDEGDASAPANNDNAQGNQPAPELEGQLIDNDDSDADGSSGEGDASGSADSQEDKDTPDAGGAGTGEDSQSGAEVSAPADTGSSASVPRQEPVADPGTEFTPKNDYSFDIELADGSKVHIAKPEDIEQLPKDADFGTPANLMLAQGKLNAMMSGIDQERRDWEASKAKFDDQQQRQAAMEERINQAVAEMSYLEGKGLLPKVADDVMEADWSDPKVQQQPGVKERLELLNYRAKENETRTKLGLSPMSLIDAASQMRLEHQDKQAAEVKDKQAQVRKAKGAMVGGAGPAAPTSIPDDLIIGEGGSIRDLNPAY